MIGKRYERFAVVVLTKNEESTIEACLTSVKDVADRFVVDSGSTDATRTVAACAGATVVTHETDGAFLITRQREWALENLPLECDWVLFMDADERATEAYLADVDRHVRDAGSTQGFWCAPKFIYQGTWLRRYMGYPNWHPRVMKRGTKLTGGLWESFSSDSVVDYIREPYLHFPDAKGLAEWVERHLRYAKTDATISSSSETVNGEKRQKLRNLARRLGPIRPWVVVAHSLFVRGGIFDRGSVWSYARRHLIYELLICEANREARIFAHGGERDV